MGIRAPSLYTHIRDKQALRAALISDAFERWADRFERALAQADDPLAALASEYRSFALDHPHLYRLMNERPLSRDCLVAGVEERADPRAQRPLSARRRPRRGLALRHRRVPQECAAEIQQAIQPRSRR